MMNRCLGSRIICKVLLRCGVGEGVIHSYQVMGGKREQGDGCWRTIGHALEARAAGEKDTQLHVPVPAAGDGGFYSTTDSLRN